MKASMHSYYGPFALEQVINRVSEQRGEQMDVRCFHNDRRLQVRPEDVGPVPSPDQLQDALSRSTLSWEEPTDQSDEPFMANIEDIPGTIACTVNMDTHYLSPSRTETFLREMEAILVSAAFSPGAPTGI